MYAQGIRARFQPLELGAGWPLSRHRQQVSRTCGQARRQAQEIGYRGYRPTDNSSEFFSSEIRLHPGLNHNSVPKPKLYHRLAQKSDLLAVAVEQIKDPLRCGNRKRDTRQTGTSSQVEEFIAAQVREHGQAVEQVPGNHLQRRAHGGQIVGPAGPAPALEKQEVTDHSVGLVAVQSNLHPFEARCQSCRYCSLV